MLPDKFVFLSELERINTLRWILAISRSLIMSLNVGEVEQRIRKFFCDREKHFAVTCTMFDTYHASDLSQATYILRKTTKEVFFFLIKSKAFYYLNFCY